MLWPVLTVDGYCVRIPDPICRKQHDRTSDFWICRRSRSPGCLRNWAPGVAEGPRFTKGDWRTAILLLCGTSNLLYPGTAGRVASCSIDAWRDALLDLDYAR